MIHNHEGVNQLLKDAVYCHLISKGYSLEKAGFVAKKELRNFVAEKEGYIYWNVRQ